MVKVKQQQHFWQQPHGEEKSGHVEHESEVIYTNTKLRGLNVVGSVNQTEFVEWVESPIRAHDNKLRHEVPLPHSGSVPESPQQAFMNFEVNDTSMSLCAEPVPVLPPACMQPGIGTVEHAQQQNLIWFVVCFAGSPGAALRHGPDLNAECTGITLLKNEVFSVDQQIASPDGRIYLRLADGRGWAFDDSVLAPEDPSVVRMDFQTVSNPFTPWHTTSTLQHVEQAQYLEPMASSCPSCSYPIDAGAKFCIICGEKQPSPLGIANPGCEVLFPYYQYQVHPNSEAPWLTPSMH